MPRKPRKRSAIVPATVFALGLAAGAAVIPALSSCGDDGGPQLTVAQVGFDMPVGLDVAAFFDMAHLGVADIGFKD